MSPASYLVRPIPLRRVLPSPHLEEQVLQWPELNTLLANQSNLPTNTGDTAVFLLKEGADPTIKNIDEVLAIDLAPDKDVRGLSSHSRTHEFLVSCQDADITP